MLAKPVVVAKRDQKGKNAVRSMRKQGQTPGIIYGCHKEPIAVSVNSKEFHLSLHSGDRMWKLDAEDGSFESKTVLVKEVQFNELTQEPLHVDFEEIAMDEKIHLTVPLELKGTSAGQKAGGVVSHLLHDVDVECLPASLPEKIIVDISALEIGDNLHLSDIVLPEGVVALTSGDTTVVAVTHHRGEEEPAAVEEAEEGKTQPEVITKERKEASEDNE